MPIKEDAVTWLESSREQFLQRDRKWRHFAASRIALSRKSSFFSFSSSLHKDLEWRHFVATKRAICGEKAKAQRRRDEETQ